MALRRGDGVLGLAVGWDRCLVARVVVGVAVRGVERRKARVVVWARWTAPRPAEDRLQAVTALTVMIGQWWSDSRSRSAGNDGESDQHGGARTG